MRIGVIGWYGHDNQGDERMLYCLKKYFSNCDFFIASGWKGARKNINELNRCDYILIGGGGLVYRAVAQHIDIVEGLKRPFGLVGVSVEAKHRGMDDFLEVVKQRADFIVVRDKQSQRYFDHDGKVVASPDLTFLYPFNIVEEVSSDICALNLRDWYYWKSAHQGVFENLMISMDNRLAYRLRQPELLRRMYPLRKWDPDRIVKIIRDNFTEVLPSPYYFESKPGFLLSGLGRGNDVDVLSRYFTEVPTTFDIGLYRKVRYVIGMRYHALIFAMQCGIPFISLSYQPKNASFCHDSGLDKQSIDVYDLAHLEEKINYLKNNYSLFREYLILKREKFVKEIHEIFANVFSSIKAR